MHKDVNDFLVIDGLDLSPTRHSETVENLIEHISEEMDKDLEPTEVLTPMTLEELDTFLDEEDKKVEELDNGSELPSNT